MRTFKDNEKVYNAYTGKEVQKSDTILSTSSITFHNDGTSSMQIGSFSYHSDGTSSNIIGNFIYTNGKSVYIG